MEAAFDLERHRRDRNVTLQRRVDYLEGERHRLELLLAILLRMAARTAKCDPTLILDACCTIAGTNPAIAHIHQA